MLDNLCLLSLTVNVFFATILLNSPNLVLPIKINVEYDLHICTIISSNSIYFFFLLPDLLDSLKHGLLLMGFVVL